MCNLACYAMGDSLLAKEGFLLRKESFVPVAIKRGKLQRKQSGVTQWQHQNISCRSSEIIRTLIFSLNRSETAPGYFQQREMRLSEKEISLPSGDGIINVHFVTF
ncbi:hypothetical protein ABKU69_06140 [Enterobacter hormaechei]|uniref:hypothetical protein n=1 Tax=Enterobacter hormaechei TaxID=158836 RepID=UPI001C1349EF|nr:hypothetical protein [Enterobacter hormaechei]MCW4909812.1 hypothetical protein [Enterobacter hormaechei subsp. xiangfangensis]HAV1613513.1 hypothetical protein [Enterobacter hormaechei subsp. xiangfangensis]